MENVVSDDNVIVTGVTTAKFVVSRSLTFTQLATTARARSIFVGILLKLSVDTNRRLLTVTESDMPFPSLKHNDSLPPPKHFFFFLKTNVIIHILLY